MTLEALDDNPNGKLDEIDVILKRIPLLVNNDEVKIEENGTNGIGWFYFSYRVQNSDSKNACECSIINSVTTTVANPLPTSYTCNESVPVDNSTDQPLAVSCSSLWALIAVAIMLLVTLFVTIIIAICIFRNMSKKLKETKERNVPDRDGEHTCTCVYRKSFILKERNIHCASFSKFSHFAI